jgi:hypothetical protein
MPSLQGVPLRQEENEVKNKLVTVKSELDGKGSEGKRMGRGLVGGDGNLRGQVNELWGVVEELKVRNRVRMGGKEGWLGDESALGEVAQVSRVLGPEWWIAWGRR